MNYGTIIKKIQNGNLDEKLTKLYGARNLGDQKKRYLEACDAYLKLFKAEDDMFIISAPGRTEIGGNHTDHNKGKVIAGSVDLDVIAIVHRTNSDNIIVKSKGYDADEISLNDLEPSADEAGKSKGLIRGVCAKLKELGYKIGGFEAYTTSNILKGSGLSSSAGFEVLIVSIINYLFNDGKIDAVTAAKTSQFAENIYFGKPCGLLDQMACAEGGMVNIDFKDENPVIKKIDFDFSKVNHALCIVNTGGNHSDLTDDYASIRYEMNRVANFFGKEVLREIDEKDFVANLGEITKKCGYRAVLRAYHFFNENKRVDAQVKALENNDFEEFKKLIIESGDSSYKYNQNIYSCKYPENQQVSVALAMSEMLLKGKGAWRVHGGGFAGTIQAFVPSAIAEEYKAEMEKVFGEGSCYILSIRSCGGVQII